MTIRPRRSLLNPDLKRPSALLSVPRDPNALWLDKNENLNEELIALGHETLKQIPALALATYPEAAEIYRKLASWVGVPPEFLILTPGSDGAIRLVFEAFVEHGDTVVHTTPTFAMYPVYCQMFGAEATAIEYASSESGPGLDYAAIINALHKHKPKLLCLPNPDSPTGTVFAPGDLRLILKECESVEAILLLDEAYHPFYEWSGVPWTETSTNLIVARTFAKAWSAAGMRIGYAVAHPETLAYLHKMRPMYEVSTIAVEFMARMLDNVPAMLAAVASARSGKEFFVHEMGVLGFKVLPTHGNFVHVAFGERGPRVHAALKSRVLYRSVFDQSCLSGYSRFTVAPREIMSKVVDMIKKVSDEK